MILVDKNFLTPRTPDVITLQDADGDYIYVNREMYDIAVIFGYTTQGDISKMEEAVLGDKQKATYGNKDILSIMVNIYQTVPEPLNMMAPFLMLAESIKVPEDLTSYEEKEFAYNLIDIICNSIDTRSYVKLPSHMRSPLTGLQHLAKEYKKRNAHTTAMWFTGQEILPITEVVQVGGQQPVTSTEKTAPIEENKQATPLPIPLGSITTIPAADKETAEPMPYTISEEEFEELQRLMAAEDEEFEQKQKKQKEEQKTVKVSVEVKEKAELNSLFDDVLKGI